MIDKSSRQMWVIYWEFHLRLEIVLINWTASSEFGTYRLCEQRRFRRAYASAQSRQNLRCSLIQAVSQAEPSDRKPDLWSLWMAGHAKINLSWRNARRHKFAWWGSMNPFWLEDYCILINWTSAGFHLWGVWCSFFFYPIFDGNSFMQTVQT